MSLGILALCREQKETEAPFFPVLGVEYQYFSCVFTTHDSAVRVLLGVLVVVYLADQLVRRRRTRTRPSGTGVPTTSQQ